MRPLSAQAVTIDAGAGLNVSWVTGADGEPVESRTGAVRYLRVRLSPSQRFGLEVGLQYSEKGYVRPEPAFQNTQEGDPGSTIDSRFRFTYLEIPVIATFVVPVRGSLGLQLSAGVSSAFTRAAQYGPFDIRDQVRDSELNAILGTGLVYWWSRYLLQFDVRYSAATASYVHRTPLPPIDSRNRAVGFTLGAGVRIPSTPAARAA